MLLVIAAVSIAALFLCEWIASRRRANLETAIALRDAFFASAEALVRDPETPQSIIDLLEACANSITEPKIGRLVIRCALANRLPPALADHDDEESLRFTQDVAGMRDDLRRTLADAAMQYAQAASFNNFLLGGMARRLSAVWLAGPAYRSQAQPNTRLMIDVTPKLVAPSSSVAERDQSPAAAVNGSRQAATPKPSEPSIEELMAEIARQIREPDDKAAANDGSIGGSIGPAAETVTARHVEAEPAAAPRKSVAAPDAYALPETPAVRNTASSAAANDSIPPTAARADRPVADSVAELAAALAQPRGGVSSPGATETAATVKDFDIARICERLLTDDLTSGPRSQDTGLRPVIDSLAFTTIPPRFEVRRPRRRRVRLLGQL